MFKQHSFFINFWSRQQLSILLKDAYCDTLRRICHKCWAYSWCLQNWQAEFSFTDPFQLFCDQAMASSSYYSAQNSANQTNGALIGICTFAADPDSYSLLWDWLLKWRSILLQTFHWNPSCWTVYWKAFHCLHLILAIICARCFAWRKGSYLALTQSLSLAKERIIIPQLGKTDVTW